MAEIIYKVCSFFGHREMEVSEELKNRLKIKLEDMIVNENYGLFFFGGLGMFDYLCWQVVSELKEKYPHIRRIFCLYDPRHQRYLKRPAWMSDENFEEIVYLDLEFDYWYSRIYYRNIEMINQSDFVIFYVAIPERSGAYKAMQHAIKKKKGFINLAIESDI
ncbi:MAG: hypothetical protein IJX25_01935 [Clostridia bacterium]|nr:hypothetical protein [Clostridia bacterium]